MAEWWHSAGLEEVASGGPFLRQFALPRHCHLTEASGCEGANTASPSWTRGGPMHVCYLGYLVDFYPIDFLNWVSLHCLGHHAFQWILDYVVCL